MIIAEPCHQDLALLVPCFKTEDSGLALAAFNILPFGAVGEAEVDDVGS
jgi:hypothetical protein